MHQNNTRDPHRALSAILRMLGLQCVRGFKTRFHWDPMFLGALHICGSNLFSFSFQLPLNRLKMCNKAQFTQMCYVDVLAPWIPPTY